MRRLEAAVVAACALVIVVGVAAYDWRLGLVVLGLCGILSVIDIPRRRV